MAVVPAPVTAAVVRWAVQEDGRRPADLAEKLRVDEETFLAWAEGDEKPSTGQVTKLAELLRRPRALFFLPAPPEGAALPAAFRHPPGSEQDVSQAARLQVRRARRVQDAVSTALRDHEPVDLPRIALTEAPEAAAAQAREWCGVSVSEQTTWRGGDYAAFNGWRAALDARGLLVFSIEIGRGEVRGFSCWDPWSPLIVVNSSAVSPAARVFTLGHELGHLLTRTDAACIEPQQRLFVEVDVERWCERFAAAFLMPAGHVRTFASRRKLRDRGAEIEDVKALMTYFQVSARAAALRLIDLGYAGATLYADVEKTFRPREQVPQQRDDVRRPPTHIQRERQYGTRALRTVLQGLPEHQALRVLRMTVDDARKIAERVPGIDAVF